MKITTKEEVLELLSLPYEEFETTVIPEAKRLYREQRGDVLISSAMLGFSNICKNRCLYCGMRAGSAVERYRISVEDVVAAAHTAQEMGFRRMF